MEIKGLANTTLLDYPGHVAATVFTGGCNFKCPFCYNKSLVLSPNRIPSIPTEEIYAFLESRRSALDGVCITGGEPLLQEDLLEFLYNIKMMGFQIKLDTNGYDPTALSHILKERLVDYVAMDIKGSLQTYAKVSGIRNVDINRIKLSTEFLMDSEIEYEFRTTIVRELHTRADIEAIGQWLAGARSYYLQPYVENDDVIMPIFSSVSRQEMYAMRNLLLPYIRHVEVRGYTD